MAKEEVLAEAVSSEGLSGNPESLAAIAMATSQPSDSEEATTLREPHIPAPIIKDLQALKARNPEQLAQLSGINSPLKIIELTSNKALTRISSLIARLEKELPSRTTSFPDEIYFIQGRIQTIQDLLTPLTNRESVHRTFQPDALTLVVDHNNPVNPQEFSKALITQKGAKGYFSVGLSLTTNSLFTELSQGFFSLKQSQDPLDPTFTLKADGTILLEHQAIQHSFHSVIDTVSHIDFFLAYGLTQQVDITRENPPSHNITTSIKLMGPARNTQFEVAAIYYADEIINKFRSKLGFEDTDMIGLPSDKFANPETFSPYERKVWLANKRNLQRAKTLIDTVGTAMEIVQQIAYPNEDPDDFIGTDEHRNLLLKTLDAIAQFEDNQEPSIKEAPAYSARLLKKFTLHGAFCGTNNLTDALQQILAINNEEKLLISRLTNYLAKIADKKSALHQDKRNAANDLLALFSTKDLVSLDDIAAIEAKHPYIYQGTFSELGKIFIEAQIHIRKQLMLINHHQQNLKKQQSTIAATREPDKTSTLSSSSLLSARRSLSDVDMHSQQGLSLSSSLIERRSSYSSVGFDHQNDFDVSSEGTATPSEDDDFDNSVANYPVPATKITTATLNAQRRGSDVHVMTDSDDASHGGSTPPLSRPRSQFSALPLSQITQIKKATGLFFSMYKRGKRALQFTLSHGLAQQIEVEKNRLVTAAQVIPDTNLEKLLPIVHQYVLLHLATLANTLSLSDNRRLLFKDRTAAEILADRKELDRLFARNNNPFHTRLSYLFNSTPYQIFIHDTPKITVPHDGQAYSLLKEVGQKVAESQLGFRVTIGAKNKLGAQLHKQIERIKIQLGTGAYAKKTTLYHKMRKNAREQAWTNKLDLLLVIEKANQDGVLCEQDEQLTITQDIDIVLSNGKSYCIKATSDKLAAGEKSFNSLLTAEGVTDAGFCKAINSSITAQILSEAAKAITAQAGNIQSLRNPSKTMKI